jgi:hypothetical protein
MIPPAHVKPYVRRFVAAIANIPFVRPLKQEEVAAAPTLLRVPHFELRSVSLPACFLQEHADLLALRGGRSGEARPQCLVRIELAVCENVQAIGPLGPVEEPFRVSVSSATPDAWMVEDSPVTVSMVGSTRAATEWTGRARRSSAAAASVAFVA